jgi:hypothetical protein
MAKQLPAPRRLSRPVQYIDAVPRVGEVTLVTRAELAARRRRDAEQYARWLLRQEEIAERDRKVRRFLLGLGAAVGTGLLAAIAIGGWLIWQALATAGVGVLAVPVVLLVAAGLVVGGHRCITVVQHWH